MRDLAMKTLRTLMGWKGQEPDTPFDRIQGEYCIDKMGMS